MYKNENLTRDVVKYDKTTIIVSNIGNKDTELLNRLQNVCELKSKSYCLLDEEPKLVPVVT